MSYVSGAALPKTTKNNISKFYTHGGNSQDINSGFLNALSTPQNKQNSMRGDGIVGVSANNSKNMAKNMNIR